MTFNYGEKYEGNWFNDKIDGFGKYYFQDGETYIGEFSKGQIFEEGYIDSKDGYDNDWISYENKTKKEKIKKIKIRKIIIIIYKLKVKEE